MVDITESHRQLAQLLHHHGRDGSTAMPQLDGEAWWSAAVASGMPTQARTASY